MTAPTSPETTIASTSHCALSRPGEPTPCPRTGPEEDTGQYLWSSTRRPHSSGSGWNSPMTAGSPVVSSRTRIGNAVGGHARSSAAEPPIAVLGLARTDAHSTGHSQELLARVALLSFRWQLGKTRERVHVRAWVVRRGHPVSLNVVCAQGLPVGLVRFLIHTWLGGHLGFSAKS
jgi:hypothetical protein